MFQITNVGQDNFAMTFLKRVDILFPIGRFLKVEEPGYKFASAHPPSPASCPWLHNLSRGTFVEMDGIPREEFQFLT